MDEMKPELSRSTPTTSKPAASSMMLFPKTSRLLGSSVHVYARIVGRTIHIKPPANHLSQSSGKNHWSRYVPYIDLSSHQLSRSDLSSLKRKRPLAIFSFRLRPSSGDSGVANSRCAMMDGWLAGKGWLLNSSLCRRSWMTERGGLDDAFEQSSRYQQVPFLKDDEGMSKKTEYRHQNVAVVLSSLNGLKFAVRHTIRCHPHYYITVIHDQHEGRRAWKS
ncbi:hypothetical protein BT67DRAFT_434063 [Trichocladium antarcticum]|uniref:Uncharacterized protein n=1 Tax=Trichocladium antarcticum TaxID=1450529 RepID=A0AAN6UKJ1_9PEZI|nr:hypothetical protein BT67DRAFT_434063 [Trichocladium antarcticum]